MNFPPPGLTGSPQSSLSSQVSVCPSSVSSQFGSPSGPAPPAASPSPYVLPNSVAIRGEIQRFESVHPNIYAIYDLIERVDDLGLQNQIREHVISIEDSFVNSQEWTLSRSVPELKVGIVGNLSSGKSALVHRYLTGTYVQEESPEGGRFKKEIVVDGQSYLLLIRDEGGPPEMQFAAWVDAVVFVFSLEDEISFQTVFNYYARLSSYRNTAGKWWDYRHLIQAERCYRVNASVPSYAYTHRIDCKQRCCPKRRSAPIEHGRRMWQQHYICPISLDSRAETPVKRGTIIN